LKSTRLFKQRVIWLPKAWVLVVMLLFFIAITLFCFKNIALYLALNKPNHSQYLVVEGWQSEQSLLQALNTFREGAYQYLITTGGPDTRTVSPRYKSFAEESAAFLLSRGIDAKKLIIVSAPASAQNRTFLSAVMVRDWFVLHNVLPVSIDVFTEGVHARRTRILYQKAFGTMANIGIYASEPESYDLQAWWDTSTGAKSVITEVVGMLWVTCFFNPGEQGSHQEKWGLVRSEE
jgi:hypothetical protein